MYEILVCLIPAYCYDCLQMINVLNML